MEINEAIEHYEINVKALNVRLEEDDIDQRNYDALLNFERLKLAERIDKKLKIKVY